MAIARAYTSARYFVELDGKPAGYVVDASGGEPVAAVAEAAPDASGVIKKELGAVGYEPIVLHVSTGAAKELYDWIAAVPARKQRPHDGALILLDYNNSEQARLTWTDGVISELVFPALDGSSKDAAAIAVTIQPGSTRYVRSAGGTHPSFSSTQRQKRLQAGSFRVSISGLPTFSTHVSRVEPISVRQEIDAGDRAPTLGAVHVGNVEVTGGEAWAGDLRSWLDDFVKEQRGDKKERSLTVELLSPNLTDALLTLSLQQVGIFTLAEAREERKDSAVARVRAGLYAEELAVAVDQSIVGVADAAPPSQSPPPTPTAREALTTEGFLDAWRTGVRAPRLPAPPETVAARLRATAAAPAPVEVVNAREDEGRRFGEMWAREIGSLDERDVVTELAGAEWTTATLPENHSLLRALGRAGAAADPDVTSSLSDDPFIRGVVAGAASVRQELAGLLHPAD